MMILIAWIQEKLSSRYTELRRHPLTDQSYSLMLSVQYVAYIPHVD